MTVNYLKTEILQFQYHANLLSLSSLKGWVRDSAFSVYRFLIPTPQMCNCILQLFIPSVVFNTLVKPKVL